MKIPIFHPDTKGISEIEVPDHILIKADEVRHWMINNNIDNLRGLMTNDLKYLARKKPCE